MNILFCDNPFEDKALVDIDFEDEFIAANRKGFELHLFSYDSLVNDSDIDFALRRVKVANVVQKMIYRGWMLKPHQYKSLYSALLVKNYQLINTPTEYQNCHYFPDSYRFIQKNTPETIWMSLADHDIDYEKLQSAISIFGTSPLIIKDYVKSQKHYWDIACYIPSAADKAKVKSVVQRFLELQNTDLNEGIVIREFVELNELTVHSKSGMPLQQEYRLFFVNNQLLGCYNYWEEGAYSVNEQPPLNLFREIAKEVESNFFSMDIAKTKSGDWIIIELGDGQVAGLPDKVERLQFYELLYKIVAEQKKTF